MFYNEIRHEEDRQLIWQLAEQTERGKINWELTEYNPPSFLSGDKVEKLPAVIGQMFSFEAVINGSLYGLDITEDIKVPSGMGDYAITLMREDEYSARDCAPQPLKLSIHSGGIEHPCRRR